jgi:hypothetical protein
MRDKIVSFSLWMITALVVGAQPTIVRGTIYDGGTNPVSPLFMANVLFPGTTSGTITNDKGQFELTVNLKPSRVTIRAFGYSDTTLKIKPGTVNDIQVTLYPTATILKEQTIVYRNRKPPAIEVIDSVKKYRRENDPFRFKSVEARVYTKTQIDAYNLSEKFVKGKMTRAFKPVFDLAYVGRYEGDTATYYPFIFAEMFSKIYKRKGGTTREVIYQFDITGIQNDDFAQFIGAAFQDFNFYDDNQLIIATAFIGPLSPFGTAFYKYELTDTILRNDGRFFRITFEPADGTPRDYVYEGSMIVNDSSWAVASFNLKMNPNANINYIKGFEVEAEFSRREDGTWMLTKDRSFLDFDPKDFVDFTMNLGKKSDKNQLLIRRNRFFDQHTFNEPPSDIFPVPGAEIDILDNIRTTKAVWDSIRPEPLSTTEAAIDSAIEAVKLNPIFRLFYKIGDFASSGFWNFGYFGYGPLYETYSMNAVEGHRIKIGGRTSDSLSRRFYSEAHLIYGTRDQKFKWDFSGVYHVNKDKNPWRMAGWMIRQDADQLGLSRNQWRADNFIGTFLRRRALVDLAYVDEVSGFYEHDFFTGFNGKIALNWLRVYDTGNLRFGILNPNGDIDTYLPHFTRSEIILETTLAYGAQWLRGRVKRRALRGEYPAINIRYTAGLKGVLGSGYEYHGLRCSIGDRTRIKPIGYSDWDIQFGKIWGTIPYPLMEIHLGNDTYMYDLTGWNLMNYFEFVSDQFAQIRIEHFFEGFFLNKIPGIRKLKWKEVITAKALIGSISDQNKMHMALPPNTYELIDQRTGEYVPYVELGFGIENIFNLLRLDFIYRATHQRGPNPNNPGTEYYPNTPRWGILGGIALKL